MATRILGAARPTRRPRRRPRRTPAPHQVLIVSPPTQRTARWLDGYCLHQLEAQRRDQDLGGGPVAREA
jgi:hypothetical protein